MGLLNRLWNLTTRYCSPSTLPRGTFYLTTRYFWPFTLPPGTYYSSSTLPPGTADLTTYHQVLLTFHLTTRYYLTYTLPPGTTDLPPYHQVLPTFHLTTRYFWLSTLPPDTADLVPYHQVLLNLHLTTRYYWPSTLPPHLTKCVMLLYFRGCNLQEPLASMTNSKHYKTMDIIGESLIRRLMNCTVFFSFNCCVSERIF